MYLILDRAERELVLNENTSGSQTLFNNAMRKLAPCLSGTIMQASPVEEDIISQPIFLIFPVFVSLAGVFGFLWFRTAKRELQESKSKE
jgi:hypothetical protein